MRGILLRLLCALLLHEFLHLCRDLRRDLRWHLMPRLRSTSAEQILRLETPTLHDPSKSLCVSYRMLHWG